MPHIMWIRFFLLWCFLCKFSSAAEEIVLSELWARFLTLLLSLSPVCILCLYLFPPVESYSSWNLLSAKYQQSHWLHYYFFYSASWQVNCSCRLRDPLESVNTTISESQRFYRSMQRKYHAHSSFKGRTIHSWSIKDKLFLDFFFRKYVVLLLIYTM